MNSTKPSLEGGTSGDFRRRSGTDIFPSDYTRSVISSLFLDLFHHVSSIHFIHYWSDFLPSGIGFLDLLLKLGLKYVLMKSAFEDHSLHLCFIQCGFWCSIGFGLDFVICMCCWYWNLCVICQNAACGNVVDEHGPVEYHSVCSTPLYLSDLLMANLKEQRRHQ